MLVCHRYANYSIQGKRMKNAAYAEGKLAGEFALPLVRRPLAFFAQDSKMV